MKVQLAELLTRVEVSGYTADPLLVYLLCQSLRKYAGLVVELARALSDETSIDFDRLADLMADARTVELPE